MKNYGGFSAISYYTNGKIIDKSEEESITINSPGSADVEVTTSYPNINLAEQTYSFKYTVENILITNDNYLGVNLPPEIKECSAEVNVSSET